MNVPPKPHSFQECFSFFYDRCVSRSSSQFLPFTSRKDCAPFLALPTNPSDIGPGAQAEYNSIWGSYLIARDILFSPNLGQNCKCGVEYYNPTLFARQFGLTQLIPIPPYPSLNRNISDRDIVGDMKWVLRVREKSDDLKNQFCFCPF